MTLYQFYHDRGLKERKASFRKQALAQVTGYDVDVLFKQIDGRP